jgi:DNA-binding transcriptional ArsR family regulator
MDRHIIDSPEGIRALAHPLRLAILRHLRRAGPATVTSLATQLDVGTASVSYHVQQLAKYGFVTAAPHLARNRKESWWQATAQHSEWAPEAFGDEGMEAAGLLWREVASFHTAQIDEYQRNAQDWGPQWAAVTGPRDYRLHLAPHDMAALLDEIDSLVKRYQTAQPNQPDEAAAASLVLYSYPHK